MDDKTLCEAVCRAGTECAVSGCMGQRFMGAGLGTRSLSIEGVPGNAWGANLDGVRMEVHGNLGDAADYAMRGGKIYARGNAGYRADIPLKAYKDTLPVMGIGGCTGSFLGEYQAAGLIIVLGLDIGDRPIASNFPGTGMQGVRRFFALIEERLHFPVR